MDNCYSIKCCKQQDKYRVSSTKIFTSVDIELNPDPVNGFMLLQSRLAECGLSILDVGGAGDCFLEQYLINCMVNLAIICGVQYMRANPDRFIESIIEHSWARYLANMSQKGTWAELIVMQAAVDAFLLTINIVDSNQGFAPHTAVSPIAIPVHEPTVINIGHVDVVHYVSTIPYNEEVVETNLSCSNQCLRVIGNEAMD